MSVVEHYSAGDEDGRMARNRNRVEWVRTCELLDRWLPPPPATVVDAGGGPGRQARHLMDLGYRVTLYDLVPKHVEQASTRGVRAEMADARWLPEADATADAVLLLGPLYHLPDPADRARALAEATRVLRPGGVVVVAALSRWARVFVRASLDELADPAHHRHTLTSMRDGRVGGSDSWDEVAYLHDPGELAAELTAAGLREPRVVGVEGPAGAWARRDPALNEHALELARLAETAMAETSIHLLATATRPPLPVRPG